MCNKQFRKLEKKYIETKKALHWKREASLGKIVGRERGRGKRDKRKKEEKGKREKLWSFQTFVKLIVTLNVFLLEFTF